MRFFKWLARGVAWVWNPWLIRDRTGKIVDDFPRRRHSKQVRKSGVTGIVDRERKPRCFRVGVGGSVEMSGTTGSDDK